MSDTPLTEMAVDELDRFAADAHEYQATPGVAPARDTGLADFTAPHGSNSDEEMA